MYDLVFLSSAIGEIYEEFLIPFTFFALINTPNSFVEIIVCNKDTFQKNYKKEIEELVKIVGKNFSVRNFSNKLNNNIPNTYRFFEIPENKGKYTYIIDVDIMLMENVLPVYLKTWVNDNIPYHNIIRPNSQRITGVHMVKTEEYYTPKYCEVMLKYYKNNKNTNDEMILYKMISESHKMIDKSLTFRPILGIHFSPNRGVGKEMPHKTNQVYYKRFMELKEKYPVLFNFSCFQNLTKSLKNFKIT